MLFRQGTERFAQQRHAFAGKCQLARFGAEQLAANPHDIADIEFFENSVCFGSHVLARSVALNAPCPVHDVKEGDFPERTVRHDTARAGEAFVHVGEFISAVCFELCTQHACVMLLDEAVRVQGNAGLQQFTGFDDAVFDDFVQLILVGEALKHGHEVARVSGLGRQLDRLVFRVLVAQGRSPS